MRAEAIKMLAHYCKMVRKADRKTVRFTGKAGYATTANNFRLLRDEYQERADALSRFLVS